MTKSYYFPLWMYKRLAKSDAKKSDVSHIAALNEIALYHGFRDWKMLKTNGQLEVLKETPYSWESSSMFGEDANHGFLAKCFTYTEMALNEETDREEPLERELHLLGAIVKQKQSEEIGVLRQNGQHQPDFGDDILGAVKVMAFGQEIHSETRQVKNYHELLSEQFLVYEELLNDFSIEAIFIWDDDLGEGFVIPKDIDNKPRITRAMAAAQLTFRYDEIERFTNLPSNMQDNPKVRKMYGMAGGKGEPYDIEELRHLAPEWPT